MEQRTFGPVRNVSPQSLRGLHDDGATPDVPTPNRWDFEGFTLDLAGRTLTDAFGKEVLLWRSEFALLLAFLRAPGHALTREHLLNAVSGRDAEAFDRSIDVLVGRLRRKIEPDPRAPRLIVTLPGVGYKFAVRARVAAPPAEEEPDVLPPTATPTHHRAERRQMTILRCEIVSTGALAATLDPEDWFETAAAFRNCCSQIVTRFGGSVAPAAGDDVIAWFGYPEASEFDAEYAIQAGLTLVRAVPKLRVGPKVPLRARAGIASGLAVIRIRATATESAQTVAGEASSLAAVLLSRAPADTVLIAASTRRLVRGLFEQRAFEPVAAQGFTEPIEAWQVTDRNASASRFLALRAPELSPLVGRDEELDLLLRRWEQAKAGRGRLVLVSGEPGIGKSRLLHAFEQRLPPETANTLRYFCSPHRAERAFFAVIEQFERAAGFLRADSAEEKVGKLETLLAPSAVSDEQISLIAGLIGIKSSDRYLLPEFSPHQRKDKVLAALVAQIRGLAARRPVVVLYEDLQWIDPSSLELLSLVIERIARLPVLVLATARPEFRPTWAEEAHLTSLTLRRLDHSDARKLVTSVAAGKPLSRGVAEEILAHSEGVPLFVEELTKAVLEARPGSGTEAFRREAPQIIMVPASLQSWLAARLDRLGTAREVARIGAVIGREFEYDLLFCVAGLTEGELAAALERLCDSGLMFRRGNQPEATFLFKHALIQDAAYGSLLRADRRDWHRKIAEALEAHFPETIETQPELLAYHFTEAGVAERAIGYWSKAGQQALRLSAMVEAAALLRKGLILISAVPDSRHRNEHELDLQIAYGQAMIATHGYSAPAVGQAYARARELCQELRHTNKLLPILYGQWGHHSVTDLKQARELAADIRHFCEEQDDSVARVTSCRANGLTHLVFGDFVAAIVLLEDGLALYDSAQQTAHASIYAVTDPLVFFHSYLSPAHTCCGHLDQALSLSDSALTYARSLSHAHSLAFALHWTWAARRCARFEPSVLLSQADELIALSEERSFAMWRALGLAFRGWCVSALGQPNQGIPLMTAGLAEIRVSGRLHVPHVLTLAGDAYRMAGEPRAALACVAEAEQFAEAMETRWLQAETLRLHGDLLRSVGDCTGATGRFLEAIALAHPAERQAVSVALQRKPREPLARSGTAGGS